MILGTGIDIIEIERVRKAVLKERFVQRVFSAAEAAYCRARGRQSAASFAARFAAKEAVLKALGTGHIGGSLAEIEVERGENGCPRLRLHGFYEKLAQAKGVQSIHITLSHARDYAAAQAILEGKR